MKVKATKLFKMMAFNLLNEQWPVVHRLFKS